METKVLDNGFVRLIDFMGGDFAVVQAARVSFGQGTMGKKQDMNLIDYLLQHRHETPFEQSVFKFHIKCPLFVARQWFRHRMASYNEISGRYTEMKDEFYRPTKLRRQMSKNYEYEDIDISQTSELLKDIDLYYQECFKLYRKLLDHGVAKEQARIILPLALYTQFYWTINARSLMNFLSLRVDKHAQAEIRQYADTILKMFRAKMPWTCEAFEKYYI